MDKGEKGKPKQVAVMLPVLDPRTLSAAVFSLQCDVRTVDLLVQRLSKGLDPKVVADCREQAWNEVYGGFRADKIQTATVMPSVIQPRNGEK